MTCSSRHNRHPATMHRDRVLAAFNEGSCTVPIRWHAPPTTTPPPCAIPNQRPRHWPVSLTWVTDEHTQHGTDDTARPRTPPRTCDDVDLVLGQLAAKARLFAVQVNQGLRGGQGISMQAYRRGMGIDTGPAI